MSLPSVRATLDERPLARETALALVAIAGFVVWVDLVATVVGTVRPGSALLAFVDGGVASLTVNALANGAFIVGGMAVFAVGYVRVRGFSLPPLLPDRSDLPATGAAFLAPVVLVALVHAAAAVAGGSLATVTGTNYAAGSAAPVAALVTGIELTLTVPSALLATHVVVQRSVRRAADGTVTVAVTTLVLGLNGPFEVTSTRPFMLAAAALLTALALALPVYAEGTFNRRWLTAFTAVPFAVVAGFVLIDWVTRLGGGANGAFALAEVAVVAVAAVAYERTDALLVPALAYVSLAASSEAAVFLLQVGY